MKLIKMIIRELLRAKDDERRGRLFGCVALGGGCGMLLGLVCSIGGLASHPRLVEYGCGIGVLLSFGMFQVLRRRRLSECLDAALSHYVNREITREEWKASRTKCIERYLRP